MTLDKLKALIAEGKFHHATYRTDFARGLHIYKNAEPGSGFRGFEYVGMFSEHDKAVCDEAYALTRHTGISLGAYGKG